MTGKPDSYMWGKNMDIHSIRRWVRENLNHRSLIKGFKNLWDWKGVVWNDQDFDHYFLFVVLKHKIDNMIQDFEKNEFYVGVDKDVKDMKICSLLLDRILKDEYHENVFRYHDQKWGELKLETKPCEKSGLTKLNIYREMAYTPYLEQKEREEHMRLIRQEEHLKRQDINMLFDKMKKYVRNWWW